MLFAFPSSPASPAAETVPAALASSPGLPADVKPAGEVASASPDFAGVLALADAPASPVACPAPAAVFSFAPAAEEGVSTSAGLVETAPFAAAPADPRAPAPAALLGEGSVPRAARWLKPAPAAPKPAPDCAPAFSAAAPSTVPVAGVKIADGETAAEDEPQRADSLGRKADEVRPDPIANVTPEVAIPPHAPRDQAGLPWLNLPLPPAPSGEVAVDGNGAGEGGEESSAPEAPPAETGSISYPIYNDNGVRLRLSSAGPRESSVAPFSPARQGALAAPARFSPAPALLSAPLPDADSAEASPVSLAAAAPAPAAGSVSVSAPAPIVSVAAGSTTPTAMVPGVQTRAFEASAPAAAVFAAPLPANPRMEVAAQDSSGKNIEQVVDEKGIANTKKAAGTEKADGRVVMQPAAVQAFASAAVPSAVERVEVLPALAASETPATVAARLVERVAAVAERVEARPAEPVWVRVDLAGEHRVDVKVAFRAGRVFADFRTDSEELRVALSQAWDGFVRGREAAGARWADPVFSAASPVASPAPAASAPVAAAGESQTRSDADSGRQSDRREPAPSWNDAPASRPVVSRPAANAVVSAPLVSRPDSSRHLSALA